MHVNHVRHTTGKEIDVHQETSTYRKYTDRTPPVVKKYGGKFLTRGEPVTCLEGEEYFGRLVILEFPSKEKVVGLDFFFGINLDLSISQGCVLNYQLIGRAF